MVCHPSSEQSLWHLLTQTFSSPPGLCSTLIGTRQFIIFCEPLMEVAHGLWLVWLLCCAVPTFCSGLMKIMLNHCLSSFFLYFCLLTDFDQAMLRQPAPDLFGELPRTEIPNLPTKPRKKSRNSSPKSSSSSSKSSRASKTKHSFGEIKMVPNLQV